MPDYRFDIDTAGEPRDATTVGVELHPEWNVDGRILNGGYLHAVAVRAAENLLDGPGEPVAVSTSFAAPPMPGPAEVTVQVLRRGGRLTAASATLSQGGTIALASLVTFGALDGGPAAAGPELAAPPDHVPQAPAAPMPASAPSAQLAMPAVSGPEQGIRVSPEQMPGPPGLGRVLDLAFVPEDSRWLAGDTSAGPRIRCWMSFADGRPIDPLAVTALADMAPPVSFAQGRFGWAPTLHLQIGVLARPRGTHVLLDLRGEPYDGAFVVEDGLLWDREGTLVARSRQIAVPPRR